MVKASSRVVKEFEGSEDKIEGGESIRGRRWNLRVVKAKSRVVRNLRVVKAKSRVVKELEGGEGKIEGGEGT